MKIKILNIIGIVKYKFRLYRVINFRNEVKK